MKTRLSVPPASTPERVDGGDTTLTDQRLTELEIKASYSEDLLDQLNDVIVRQQRQIDHLLRELAALRLQVEQTPQPGFRSLRDELPPHF